MSLYEKRIPSLREKLIARDKKVQDALKEKRQNLVEPLEEPKKTKKNDTKKKAKA